VAAPPLKPVSRSAELPLSFAQQRFWFLDQLEPNNNAYNIPSAVHLKGQLNRKALEQTLSEVVRRHDVLRTTFVTSAGSPVQVIEPALGVGLPELDLSDLSATERDATLQRWITTEAQRPFDLTTGPLLRAMLLRLAEDEQVLLVTMHHIISDGWSISVLVKEVATLYEAYLAGHPSPLPDLVIQYVDYAVWQRAWLQGELLDEQLAYWRRQLSAAPVLDLPTDQPRPTKQSYASASQQIALSSALTAALKALSRREGATLYMVLLAAFQVLLARYSGQTDIVVGSPIAGRTRLETEALIGLFINTLALRTDLSGNPTFSELLQRVRAVTLGAYAHQDVPFERVVEEVQPERSLNHTPIFQTMLALQNVPPAEFALSGLTLRLLESHSSTTKFDLTLSFQEHDGRLQGVARYRTSLFDEATIRHMREHFERLLEAIVDDPQQRLSKLPLLTARDEQQLLGEWNQTAALFSHKQCLHQLITQQAARTPGQVAVACAGTQLTYRQLNSRANQLAHYLQTLGVGPETVVGLFMERSVEMIVSLLGILKAGGAYVPLDPRYPHERLAYMVADAHLAVIVTNEHLLARLPDAEVKLVCWDRDAESIAAQAITEPTISVQPHNLAYMLYTSGSTGRPKGVLVEHQSVVNYIEGITARLGLGCLQNFAMVQSLTVDSCLTVVYPPLITGGCLHVIPTETALDGKALSDYFSYHQIDCLKIAPSHLAAIQPLDHTGTVLPGRLLVIGGEASRWDWVEKLQTSAPNCTIFNHYGPTEATVGMLTYKVERQRAEVRSAMLPMGRPLQNTTAYVLDPELRPVPVGVAGELYIGGVCLARGYQNQVGLTAEKFIPDPFSRQPGARIYRTGDTVRYLPEGDLEFIGRADNQVKVRGFRIELGEIEKALAQHAAVRETVVLLRDEEQGDKQLVAYLVPDPEQPPSINDLRTYLSSRLPEYMVPAAFVLLDALPRTSHGKLDRRELPAPDRASSAPEEAFVAARNSTEAALADLWSSVLGVSQIGMYDNFFELGGHSLLAAQLISRVREAFQVDVPLRLVFETPTVAGLALTVIQSQADHMDSYEMEQLLSELELLAE